MPLDQWDDEVTAALSVMLPPERVNPADAGNVLATLARHPALAKAYLVFNAYLLADSTLAERIREIAVLRTVHRRACSYLWSHHLPLGRRAGLTDHNFTEIEQGLATAELDQAVLSAVDELDQYTEICAHTWAALGHHLDDQQRMDLVFTVGAYCTLAMAVNTFQIQSEHR